MTGDLSPTTDVGEVLEYAFAYLLDTERTLSEAALDIGVAPPLNPDGTPLAVKEVRSFRAVGRAAEGRGLVITLTDGSEYQATITRSAPAAPTAE